MGLKEKNKLDSRKDKIIRLREQGKTLEYIGKKFSITRERVRQLEVIYGLQPRGRTQLKESDKAIKFCKRELCRKMLSGSLKNSNFVNKNYCSRLCISMKDPRSYIDNNNKIVHPFCTACRKSPSENNKLMNVSGSEKSLSYICRACNTLRARKYRNSTIGNKRIKKVSAEAYKRYPEKSKARQLVNVALSQGKIKKEPCFCGSTKVDGHHPDYSKPLEVLWLCRQHHADPHKKIKIENSKLAQK